MSDYSDRLLVEFRRTAEAALAERTSSSRKLVRPRLASFRRRPAALVGSVAGIVIVAGGVAVAAATLSGNAAPPDAGAPRAVVIDSAARSAFGILRRDVGPGDAVPAEDPVTFSGASGANLALARRASGFAGIDAWVVPGTGSVCLLAGTESGSLGGAACAPDPEAIAGELKLTGTSDTEPGAELVSGIVPDGITTVALRLESRLVVHAPVHENVYATIVNGTVADAVLEGDGKRIDLGAINVPPGVKALPPAQRRQGLFKSQVEQGHY
jgi:hypothetical protein